MIDVQVRLGYDVNKNAWVMIAGSCLGVGETHCESGVDDRVDAVDVLRAARRIDPTVWAVLDDGKEKKGWLCLFNVLPHNAIARRWPEVYADIDDLKKAEPSGD